MTPAALVKIVILALVVFAVLAYWKKFPPMWKALKVFYGEVAFEMTKVAWPSRQEIVNSTILVGISTLILTAMISVVDYVLMKAIGLIF
ncbi:MAG: preprotein translocase subunit SecE [bacterium]|nr:preprotein translocase subunit SecE [bacterium]